MGRPGNELSFHMFVDQDVDDHDGGESWHWIVPATGRDDLRRYGPKLPRIPAQTQPSTVIDLRIENESGSGSNEWLIEPVLIHGLGGHPSQWTIAPADTIDVGSPAPRWLDSSELPYRSLRSVPRDFVFDWGLRFTRTGAGDRKLRVRMFRP